MAARAVPSASNTSASRRWVWFRNNPGDRRERALEEFEALPAEAQAKLTVAMTRHLTGASRAGAADHLGNGIYELRVRHLDDQFRILFTGWGPHRVVLTAFAKNQRKTPIVDKRRADKRAERWLVAFPDPPDAG